jgi:hypothetical protein
MGWTAAESDFHSRYGRDFYLLHSILAGSWVHPTSYPVSAGFFVGGKAA